MPYAQNHYPFENAKIFDANFPADFIAEGLDQTRGWFYTLTVLSSALFNKSAFKNVIVNGIILSEEGKKLSKRLKNYAPPQEVLSKLGADALRLFLINSPAVKAEDLRFSESGVQEMSRAVLLPFFNAYTFFVTYANVDGWVPPLTGAAVKSDNELDRWIVSELNNLIGSVNAEMEEYNLYKVVPLLVEFIDNLTNWYIRRSRRRFWKSENEGDKNNAYTTLYTVLVDFSKVMAPFLPFLTEAIYRNLVAKRVPDAPSSVHCADFPQSNNALFDESLDNKMRLVRSIVSMGRALRSKYNLKIRQPLADMTVVIRDAALRSLLGEMETLIKEELNVKTVLFSDNEGSVVTLSAKANFKKLGKVFGSAMKDAAKSIEAFTPEDIAVLEKGGKIEVLDKQLFMDDIEVRRTKRSGVEVETQNNITVALNTEISNALLEECFAREFVNRIQTIRKNSNFKVTDRVVVACCGPQKLCDALCNYKDYVCSETLATDLSFKIEGNATAETIEIEDMKATVSVSVVS
jgi:isoleucyl-tRNA synthetase